MKRRERQEKVMNIRFSIEPEEEASQRTLPYSERHEP
jgi:hypothetical protein